MSNPQPEDRGRDGECAVCLVSLEPANATVTTPCNHNFHTHCFFAWMKRSLTCPLCRERFREEISARSSTAGELVGGETFPCQPPLGSFGIGNHYFAVTVSHRFSPLCLVFKPSQWRQLLDSPFLFP